MPPLREEDWVLPQEVYALRQTRLCGLLDEAAGRWCGYYADSGQAQQPHSNEGARLCCCWVWVWREEAHACYERGGVRGEEEEEDQAGTVQQEEGGEEAAAGSRYVRVVV